MSSTNPDLPALALPPHQGLLNPTSSRNLFVIHFSHGAKKALSSFLRWQPWWWLPTASGLWVLPPPLFTLLSQLRPLPGIPPQSLPQMNCPEFFQGNFFSCLESNLSFHHYIWSPLTTIELIQSKVSSHCPGASYQLKSAPSQWVRPALVRWHLCCGICWRLWLPGSNRGRWDLSLEGTFSIFQNTKSMEWVLSGYWKLQCLSIHPAVGLRPSFVGEETEDQRLPLACFPKATQLLYFTKIVFYRRLALEQYAR